MALGMVPLLCVFCRGELRGVAAAPAPAAPGEGALGGICGECAARGARPPRSEVQLARPPQRRQLPLTEAGGEGKRSNLEPGDAPLDAAEVAAIAAGGAAEDGLASLPTAADLWSRARREGAPLGSSWGVWGDGDQPDRLGCLNKQTAASLLAGARCVRAGRRFALDVAMDLLDPPLFSRRGLQRREINRTDDEVAFNTQSSTQWDGFGHMSEPAGGRFYNDLPQEAHSVGAWAKRGIAGRAVLADVCAHRTRVDPLGRADVNTPIGLAELKATLAAQGTAVAPGDALLVRTGWMAQYKRLDSESRARMGKRFPGLATSREMLDWLWDSHVCCICADNPAVEAWPARDISHSLHRAAIPLLGLLLGELFDLDAVAEFCAAQGRWEMMLAAAPLHAPSLRGSPANAVALM